MISGDRERYSRIFRIPMQISQDTLNLHLESIVIDAHCDSMGRELEGRRLLKDYSTLGQWDFPRAAVGGLTTEFLATFVSPERGGGGVRQTMQFIDIFHRGIEDNSDTIVQVLRADDIRTAKQTGKLGLMLSMEGAEGLEGDLRVLRNCYRLGLRCLGLTWNRRNEAADGLAESSTGGGLTSIGRKIVEECSKLGILLDIAHLAPKGVKDLLEIYQGPVLSTHANSYSLCAHPRNHTDDLLEGIARRGGVVGVTPVPPFLELDRDSSSLLMLLDHIDHIVKVMGEDGVAFSGDFDGVGDLRVVGMEDVTKLPNLTQGLVDRGYSVQAIKKILGENLLRVISQIV